MQRGGSPSCFDRVLASRLGVKSSGNAIRMENELHGGFKSR